jgi:hypothetical protein
LRCDRRIEVNNTFSFGKRYSPVPQPHDQRTKTFRRRREHAQRREPARPHPHRLRQATVRLRDPAAGDRAQPGHGRTSPVERGRRQTPPVHQPPVAAHHASHVRVREQLQHGEGKGVGRRKRRHEESGDTDSRRQRGDGSDEEKDRHAEEIRGDGHEEDDAQSEEHSAGGVARAPQRRRHRHSGLRQPRRPEHQAEGESLECTECRE